MSRLSLLVIFLGLSQTIFARVIVIEHNRKPCVEIDFSVLLEFQEISKKYNSNASLKQENNKSEPKISSKVLKIPESKSKKEIYSTSINQEESKSSKQANKRIEKQPEIKLSEAEIILKKERIEKRLAEIEQKENLIKKKIEKPIEPTKEESVKHNDKEDPNQKLSRAKNLLRRVEKSIASSRKNKQYNITPVLNGQSNLKKQHSRESVEEVGVKLESEANVKTKIFVIPFPKSVNDIKSNMHAELNKVVEILTSNQDKRVRIIGYSSSDKESDIALKRRNSLEKVVAIRKYLVDRGVNTRQVSLQAAAESSTSNTNNSDRVEIMEIGF